MSMPIFSVAGLATGFDWRKMIDELMAVERRPIQALAQRKTQLEAVKGAWGNLKLLLQAVDTKLDPFFDATTFKARVAISSSESVVKATTSAGAAVGTYSITVDRLAQAEVVASAAQPEGALGLSGTFTVNGQTITVETSDSVATIRDKINATPNVGVTAAVVNTVVDGVTKSILVLKSNTTGTAGAMTLTEDTNQVLTKLGVLVNGSPNVQVAAQDASLTVDGVAITSGSNTITNAVPGVTLELKGTGSATLEVKPDVDSMVAKIQDFVKAYNEALARLREYLVNQPGNGGPLGGDPIAQGMERKLRQLAYEAVAGLPASMDSLYEIGITTSDSTGALSVDETKLRAVLSSRPQDLADLFYSPDAAVKSVAERLREALRLWIQADTGMIPTREKGLDDLIADMVKRMQALEERLELKERRLIEQFTALERSISLLQAQAAWLEQRLASLQPQA